MVEEYTHRELRSVKRQRNAQMGGARKAVRRSAGATVKRTRTGTDIKRRHGGRN
jgi:hypothetical protein